MVCDMENFDAEKYLNSLNMFGIRLGLDATFELIRRAGNPDRKLKFIHLAGTNGKGSTSAMLERACRSWGLRTGLYTSPHLIDVRERFRIDGKVVSRSEFNSAGAELAAAATGGNFSYFEFATVLAMVIFARNNCDVVIWETGMGGRLDATNTVNPIATVITNIALDHQGHLGNTVELIAAEKAGILKENTPLFHGVLPAGAREVIYKKAETLRNVEIFPPRAAVPPADTVFETDSAICQNFNYDGHRITLSLPGRMQRENFRIAYEVLSYLADLWHLPLPTALDAMKLVCHPARLQKINSRIFLDGGHNPDGVGALVASLQELFPGEKFTVIYTAFADKEADKCIPLLAEVAESFIFTSINTEGRAAFDASALSNAAGNCGKTSAIEADPLKALTLAQTHPQRILISGSLYLAGTMLEHLCPQLDFC